jgi:hypothetical protein
MAAMSISELARAGGVGVETIRFYQRKGLLDDPRPAQGGAHGGGTMATTTRVASALSAPRSARGSRSRRSTV